MGIKIRASNDLISVKIEKKFAMSKKFGIKYR